MSRERDGRHDTVSFDGGAGELLSPLIDPAGGAFTVLSQDEDVKLLVMALQSLSVEEQAYLMWAYADHLTYPKIAERVGLTDSQVNGRIHRAREKLRRRLEEISLSPEPGALDKGFDTWRLLLQRRVSPNDEA